MKNYSLLILALFTFFGNHTLKAQEKDLSEFLQDGYVIFEKVKGDLNNDGLEDLVIITKGTDKSNIIDHEYRGELDRNRRGILVLLNSGEDNYNLVVENYDCFFSENEEGGVYFPPELYVFINNGNLLIHYSHGRYGYRKYTFRKQESNFSLIGYDKSNSNGPVVNNETSINFLTKKKLYKENTNLEAISGEEVFKETWKDIEVKNLLKLSEIEDFDSLSVYDRW